MSGTFSSLGTALSALRYHRAAMDVAGGNIANAGTAGYARRTVTAQETGGQVVPALWSTVTGVSSGVEVGGVGRAVDALLDARARTEHGTSSYLDGRSASLGRVETAIAEPGPDGVSAKLDAFRNAWATVANNPGDTGARSSLLGAAQTLRDALAGQGRAVADEWETQRVSLDDGVSEVNRVASDLATLNRSLQTADNAGLDAHDLLDQRDRLTLRLSELTGARTVVNADTTVSVTLGGGSLVSGTTATALTASGSATLAGASSSPVTLTLGGTALTLTAGEVGSAQSLLTQDLPGHLSRLDGFVSELVGAVNTQHEAGVDLAGNAGGPFWSGTTAATLVVAVTGTDQVAAAGATGGGLDNTNATAIGALDMGGGTYRDLVTGFATQVASAGTAARNQASLADQVDAARDSVSGVNQDEELVNMLAAQRGYEAASRVLTTVDSVLDTLINNTGLVGR